MAFSKLKTLLRKANERSTEGVWKRIGSLVDQVSSADCINFFTHAGYGSI